MKGNVVGSPQSRGLAPNEKQGHGGGKGDEEGQAGGHSSTPGPFVTGKRRGSGSYRRWQNSV